MRLRVVCRSYLVLALLAASGAAQPKDISGTWVAKLGGPLEGIELVYDLKVVDGRITGVWKLPMGDSPITDGTIEGNHFEFTVQFEVFGSFQKLLTKGDIVGDELHITPGVPALPPPPPPTGGAPVPPPAPAFDIGTVVARRGTPAPSFRAPSVDYKTLAKVDLPPLRAVPDNGLAKTPPMGWNSWNKFRTRIDDRTVREIADAMVATGMRDAGYVYVIIDDGWQWKRDAQGVLLPNPQFPDMKALAAYVHGKGLKLGIYSSPGPRTCAGFEGSYGHEEIDAKTWADWGVDYLKYDWCSASQVWKNEDMPAVYQRMGEAIRTAGRPMVYGLCQYGLANVWQWGPGVGGNLWRTTFDIGDQWQAMATIGFSQSDLAPYSKPGHWNDPDMLEVGNGGMSLTEYRTHFSLWALLAAPLLAGHDVRDMTPEIRDILLNHEVIAVNQDPLGRGGSRVLVTGEAEVWAKPLAYEAYAIGLFNRGATDRDMYVSWADLKLGGDRQVRDLWAHADRGSSADGFRANVPSHGVVLIRVTP